MNVDLSDDEALVLFELLYEYGSKTADGNSRSSTLQNATPCGRCPRSLRSVSLLPSSRTIPSCYQRLARVWKSRAAPGSASVLPQRAGQSAFGDGRTLAPSGAAERRHF